MTNNTKIAKQLLSDTGISIIDAVRIVKNILDFKSNNQKISNIQFCSKIVECGIKHFHIKEMSIKDGFKLYLQSKTYLRKDSFNTIKYLGNRIFKASEKFTNSNFSEISVSDCNQILSNIFTTPSQFNKALTMLHGLFQYAMSQEWIDRNVLKLIKKKKVIEKEIKSLSILEVKSLLKTSELPRFKDCRASVGLLVWAGIRPKELTRLKWKDIDLDENIITISSTTSKTGGVRHIEICKTLKHWLKNHRDSNSLDEDKITPKGWNKRWKKLREIGGFANRWVQDVLRHTYASYHTKHFSDLARLQLNMGHSNLNLLRTRYINLYNISKQDAKIYFEGSC